LVALRKATISIVVVTYNRAALLASTVESLLKQTLTGFELIIADDASSDGTQQLCEQWAARDSRIIYQRRTHNVRMPQNLNLAILSSSGDYVAILHDDDVYREDLLEKWASCLDEHEGAAFVFNAYRGLDRNGATRRVYREPLPRCSPGSSLLENIFFKRWRFDSPVWGTVMIRRSAFDHVGPYDARFGFWSDVDMYMRLAEYFDVCYVDDDIIWVTSGEVAPHQFHDKPSHMHTTLHRMFWEARMRHYRTQPIRRLGEALRHLSFWLRGRGMILAQTMKREMRRRLLLGARH
jgi:glycosyltransferase involved in cell wall biosynthesis